jgi:hypothetical protein
MSERCPICHAEALYIGLARLECPTETCPNYGSEDARSGEQLRLSLDRLMYELWCTAGARH